MSNFIDSDKTRGLVEAGNGGLLKAGNIASYSGTVVYDGFSAAKAVDVINKLVETGATVVKTRVPNGFEDGKTTKVAEPFTQLPNVKFSVGEPQVTINVPFEGYMARGTVTFYPQSGKLTTQRLPALDIEALLAAPKVTKPAEDAVEDKLPQADIVLGDNA